MSSLPLVIINPTSAGGATGRAWPRLASELRTHFGPFACAFTERAGDARVIAAREAAAGRLLIACGGDGTMHEVANGIMEAGAGAELGLLPSGTGGDFRRTLKIPARTADAALALRRGRTRRIDVGRVSYVNDEGAEESRYFLNVASFGMGGAVVERAKGDSSGRLSTSARKLGGRAAYAAAALETTLSFVKPTVRIQLDEREERPLVISNLSVANARYIGGGMKIAPAAKLDDGLFDIVAIGDMDRLTILTRVYRIYLGTHLGMRQVHHARCARLTARPGNEQDEITVEVDGELAGRLPATFEILPRALSIRVS